MHTPGFSQLPTAIMSLFKNSKFRAFLLLTVAFAAGCGEVEDTRPGQPVKHRQMAFKEMIKSFEPMGVMLRKDRYDADKFAALAADLVSKREAPWSYFGPDTNYPPTKAKPEVWSKTAEFEQAKKDFLAATDELQAAAQSKDKSRVAAPYQKVYDACQSCHRTFRER